MRAIAILPQVRKKIQIEVESAVEIEFQAVEERRRRNRSVVDENRLGIVS